MRDTLGDYLREKNPEAALWPDMVRTVFHESRTGNPERLSRAAQVLYFVGCFHGEVVNGGFSQFLSNSSGDHVGETIEALKAVGAELALSLLREALTLFPDAAAPTDRGIRCDLLFAFEEGSQDFLEALDRRYYREVDCLQGPPVEDIMTLTSNFLVANANERVSGP